MLINARGKFIVTLHSSFQDNDYLYFVMEFLAGGDFMNLLIKKDILSEQDAKFYMAELILAVEQVHEQGFIHRDLKPDNMLITKEGHIKLTDFGLIRYVLKVRFRLKAAYILPNS